MVNDKQQTTVYLSKRLIDIVKAKGINLSRVVNDVLDSMFAAERSTRHLTLDVLSGRMSDIDLQIHEAQLDVDRLNLRINELHTQRRTLGFSSEKLKDEIAQIERSKKVAKILSEINTIIKDVGYTMDAWDKIVKYQQELGELEHPIDENWLRMHIRRLQMY